MRLLLLLLLPAFAQADEGMWLPEQIPAIAQEWAERGLEIDAEQLADPLGAPLGAIVSTGGCSASFVSPEGLVATNHHCVERYLQFLSDGENNRHQDGYVASARERELNVGPTARLRVVESFEDVSARIQTGITPRTKDAARHELIERARKELVDACEQEADRCFVVSFLGGSTWRLIRTRELRDLRMVYAPPMGVGQFGGEVDNWMWPRHGADFALLRAYVAPDGSPADFDEANVPYRPPHHLEVAAGGVDEGDFVMVAGYPGRTGRHKLGSELRWAAEVSLPQGRELREQVRAVLQKHADATPEGAARLGAVINGLSNGIKNREATLTGLRLGDLVSQKEAEDAAFRAWASANKKRGKARAKAFVELEELALLRLRRARAEETANWLGRVADLLSIASRSVRWAGERSKDDLERDSGYRDRDRPRIEASFRRLDKSLHLPSDRELFELLSARYVAQPEEARIPQLDAWLSELGGREAAIEALYAEPALTGVDARLALLDMSSAELAASADPWVRLAVALEGYRAPIREAREAEAGALQRLRSQWVSAKAEWHASRGLTMYDDANSTLRLTLGHVTGYAPQDGLVAEARTRLSGIPAKAGAFPFHTTQALLDRIPEGPSSPRADPALGDVPVNFLTTLDVTGGNSGSAVLDGQGRFVGLAFDSNYEGVASDWVFVDAKTRTICVDVRFMLWVMDGEPDAAWVLEELLD